MGHGIIGFETEDFLILGDGFIHAAEFKASDGEVVAGFRVTGVEAEGFPVLVNRLVDLVLLVTGVTKVVAGVGEIRFEAKRFLELRHRGVILTLVQKGEAENVVGDIIVFRNLERMAPESKAIVPIAELLPGQGEAERDGHPCGGGKGRCGVTPAPGEFPGAPNDEDQYTQ